MAQHTKTTIHVCASVSLEGSGFSLFPSAEAADMEFVSYGSRVMHLSAEMWTAFRFDLETEMETREEIIREIIGSFAYLCTTAERKLGPLSLA